MNEVKLVITTDASNAVTGIKTAEGQFVASTQKMKDETQSFSEQATSSWDSITGSISGAQAAIAAFMAYEVVQKGAEFMQLAAAAQQAEASFTSVVQSFGVNADEMMNKMKVAAQGMIEDSDLAQRAIQGLALGLNPDQIVGLLDASRSAAKVWGKDMGDTFDKFVVAVGGGVRALGPLVQSGMLTKDEFKLVNQAIAAGIDDFDVYSLVTEKAAIMHARLSSSEMDAKEKMEAFHAAIKETKETIGSGLITVVSGLYDVLSLFPVGVVSYYQSLQSEMIKTQMKTTDLYGSSTSTWTAIKGYFNDAGSAMIYFGQVILTTIPFIINEFGSLTSAAYKYLSPIGEFLIGMFTLDKSKVENAVANWGNVLSDLQTQLNANLKSYLGTVDKLYEDHVKRMSQTPINKAINPGNADTAQAKLIQQFADLKAKLDALKASAATEDPFSVMSREVEKFADRAQALNPVLDETEKKLTEWYNAASEMASKIYSSPKLSDNQKDQLVQQLADSVTAGADYIKSEGAQKMTQAYTLLLAEVDQLTSSAQAKEYADLSKWLDEKVKAAKGNADQIALANEGARIKELQIDEKYSEEQQLFDLQIAQKGIQNELDVKLDGYTQTEAMYKDLHDHLLISDNDFFAAMQDLNQRETDDKKKALDDQFQLEINTLFDIIAARQAAGMDIKKQYEQLITLQQNYDSSTEKITRDGANQAVQINRDAANAAGQAWQQFGKDASQAISDGLLNGFTGTAKSLLDAFKKMLSQMIQTAIMNPIIIPMVQSVQGMIGGTSGGGINSSSIFGINGSSIGNFMTSPIFPSTEMQGPAAPISYGDMLGNSSYAGADLSTGGSFINSITPLNAIGAVGGAYGTYQGIKSGNPLEAGASAFIAGNALGGPIAGGVAAIAAVVASLFSGSQRPPAMGLGYYPGQNPSMQSPDYWNNTGWQGTNYQGTAGTYQAAGQHGITDATSAAFAQSLGEVGDHVKDVLTKLGMDLSGFSKDWHDYISDMSGMTQQQIETMLQGKIGDFVSAVSGINFTQFQKSGEAITDTIDAVLGSLLKFKSLVSPSDFAVSASDKNNPNAINNQTLWGTNSGWDINALWNEMATPTDSFTTAFTKFTTTVSGTVASMNQNTTDAAAWRTGLDTLSTDLTSAYQTVTQLVQQYRQLYDNIPVVFQAISDSITQNFGQEAVAAQNLQALDPALFQNFTDKINAQADAYAHATPIVDSFVKSFTAWNTANINHDAQGAATALQGMATAIQNIENAAVAMTNTALGLLSDIATKGMTDAQKVDYNNKQMATAWTAYQTAQAAYGSDTGVAKAKDAEGMTYWGGQYEYWVQQNMGITGATPNEDVKTNLQTIATDGITIQTDIRDAVTQLPGILQTDVVGAIKDVTIAVGLLQGAVTALKLDPIFNINVAAPAAVTPAAAASASTYGISAGDTQGPITPPGHASGIDYVPRDNYLMYAHAGESVITARGNEGIANIQKQLSAMEKNFSRPGTVVINVSEDLGSRLSFQTDTVNMSVVKVAQMLRDPRSW